LESEFSSPNAANCLHIAVKRTLLIHQQPVYERHPMLYLRIRGMPVNSLLGNLCTVVGMPVVHPFSKFTRIWSPLSSKIAKGIEWEISGVKNRVHLLKFPHKIVGII
jgi:hypothetical protein